MEKQTKIKIWTKKELNKGCIMSDKVTFRGVRFEIYGLSNFDNKYLNNNTIIQILKDCDNYPRLKEVINYIKHWIQQSEKYKQMVKDGYHTHIYLNINFDGVDCFLSR